MDTFYVIVRKDNTYPVLVYADSKRANMIAQVNNDYRVVKVKTVP